MLVHMYMYVVLWVGGVNGGGRGGKRGVGAGAEEWLAGGGDTRSVVTSSPAGVQALVEQL